MGEDMERMDEEKRRTLGRVRALLYEWGRAERHICDLMEQQRIATERIMELDRDIGSHAPPDGQPRSTAPGDPIWRAFQARERMKEIFADEVETCHRELEKIREFQSSVGELVAQLDPVERDVIAWRYVKGAEWLYVGFKMSMDESTARRHDREACEKLAEKMSWS